MSSPRTARTSSTKPSAKAPAKARATTRAKKPTVKAARTAASATAANAPSSEASTQAKKLAAEIERSLADGRVDLVAPEALQELMAALCKSYSAQLEAGGEFLPLRGRTSVTSTDVMTTASGLLKAANLAVFELGMWQSWTGR